MKSHVVEFELKELARWAGGPAALALLVAAVLHLGALARLLPSPRPALDTDRTVIVHQVDASRVRSGAELVLLGDSSCLMDVDARRLGAALGLRTLNLGLNSYLDLEVHARLLREFAAANPGQPRMVVLLMHPEALRRASSEPYQLAVLDHYLAGTDQGGSQFRRPGYWTGADLIRGRFLSRVLPQPLAGRYGRYYGFSADLERFMVAHDGSALDPTEEAASGNAEYRLGATLEQLSGVMRAAIPRGTRLVVGITPVPARFAGVGYPARRDEILSQWGQWLRADALLRELPAVLPDEAFTGSTHLKPAAVPAFSEKLGTALKAELR